MAAPISPTTTPIQWSIQSVSLGSLIIPSARLEIDLFLRSALPGLQVVAEIGWVVPGRRSPSFLFTCITAGSAGNASPGIRLTWAGQPCDFGTIDVWLPTQETAPLRGLFALSAKFPRSDPPGNPVPILLGLEFFLSNQAGMNLLPPTQPSTISIP
jgi:hypothetical protein